MPTICTNRRASRVTCFFLLLALCLPLAGCNAARPISPSQQDTTVVGTCDGYDIYYDEFRYVVLAYKDELKADYGEDIWENPETAALYLPALWDIVSEKIKVNYAILGMCRDFDISIDDEGIQETVTERVEEAIEGAGSRSAYKKLLKTMNMTDHFVRFTVGADACETELCYVMMDLGLILSDEKEFLMWALDDDNTCATFHIFIENNDGEDVEANRARAEEVRQKLLDGTPITDLIGSVYNEDLDEDKTPYHFFHGEYDEAYENASWSIPIGGVSEVVETDEGFYVIVRQEISVTYVTANLETLLQRYQYAEIEALLDEYEETITVEWNDYAKALDLVAME